jgi:predicted GNAT superfamily acetyltransferase
MVGVSSFVVSPIINLLAPSEGADPFANLRTIGGLLLTAVLVVAVLAASYVGARRGETLHAHNQAVIERQRSRKAREQLSEEEK